MLNLNYVSYHDIKNLAVFAEDFDKEWKADWNDSAQRKWYIFIEHHHKESALAPILSKYYDKTHRALGTIYMSEECAIKVIEHMNNGYVFRPFTGISDDT